MLDWMRIRISVSQDSNITINYDGKNKQSNKKGGIEIDSCTIMNSVTITVYHY